MQLQLLSKVVIGGQVLKNRMVLSPMTRARGTPTQDPLDPANTTPNDLNAEYYEQRASAGLLITEATAVSEAGSGWPNAPHIRTEANVEGWKKVVERVHAKHGVIYLQLWHMGRRSHSSFHPSTNDIVSASDIPLKGNNSITAQGEYVDFEKPRPLTVADIKATIQDFVKAARLAKEAGFDGVEIHSGYGYLFDQFFQSSSNKRTDQYGGSTENRLRFFKETVEALIEDGAYPANRIGFRLSPNSPHGDMGSEDNHIMFPYVAKEMSKYGMAYLHVVDGLSNGSHGKAKVVTAYDLKMNFGGPVIVNGGLTKESAEGAIRSGASDMAAFGRLYISNPDLPERFANSWPLNEDAPYEVWYDGHLGAKGYTDYPFYKEETCTKQGIDGTRMAPFTIKDSVAFVTGASKKNGIGRAIVYALLEEGAKKVYATARHASQLDDLVESNGRIVAVSLDVTDKIKVRMLGSQYPDVNLVVNNAGYYAQTSTLDDIEFAEKQIATNYIAPLAIVKSFAPVLVTKTAGADKKGSAIVNIMSIAGLVNVPTGATYSASKAASHSLTQGQRRDLPASLVIGVYPGPIDTDMAEKVPFDKTPASAVAKAIVHALKTGQEDVFPDPRAVQVYEGWKADAKAMERQMAQPQQAAA